MFETLVPPWKQFPAVRRLASFWFQGGGEALMREWQRAASAASEDERIEAFRRHAPIPVEWVDWVASLVYFDEEPEDDDAVLEQVRRLARASGLVDPDAWERWLDEPG